ncbi:MAG: [Fe-Fe] hydrogenase large subunit C-terminal domain-containing protein [Bacillota bacterium]
MNDYAYRLMVHVARAIREGNIDKADLVEKVVKECYSAGEMDVDAVRRRIRRHLDRLLFEDEDDTPPLVRVFDEYCRECTELDKPCVQHCPTGALTAGPDGRHRIDHELCAECGFCVDSCIAGALVIRSELARVAAMLLQEDRLPVYAILAPSFAGQFGQQAVPSFVKAALKRLGFTDVYEVAMAADVITMQEAREFVGRMRRGERFMITSCCCPAFIKLVEKVRPKVAHLVSPSVSPMIAMGRMLKAREPDCRVVFIGPCMAKKSEARLPDLQPAVDCVLTFKETSALFESAGLPLTGELGEEDMADASHDGRSYAFSGGVTAAITRAVKDIAPDLEIRAVKGDGLKECNRLLHQLEEGLLHGNFMEGMGCPGGCVGGPGRNISVEEGREHVRAFAEQAAIAKSSQNRTAARWESEYGQGLPLESVKTKLG